MNRDAIARQEVDKIKPQLTAHEWFALEKVLIELATSCVARGTESFRHTHGLSVEPPPEWRCEYCGYGEYKNRENWLERFCDHLAECPKKPKEAEL